MGRPLGQHFLRSPAVLADILAAANIESTDHVLEVGPGEGVLTLPLLEAANEGRVSAVEFDERLADQLVAAKHDRLHVIYGDAVKVEFPAKVDRIVSNLPYQISGPITARLIEMLAQEPWKIAVLLVQKEFATRVAANPGSKQYGRLSAHVQRVCNVRKLRDVAPGCFNPPPKVDSAVLILEPKPDPIPVDDLRVWQAVVDGAFSQRRKKLRNTLPGQLRARGITIPDVEAIIQSSGHGDSRPEELGATEFAALANALADGRP